MAPLADLIREGLQRGWNSSRFRQEADRQLNLGALYEKALGMSPDSPLPTSAIGQGQTLLEKLYEDMRQLEEAGLNGLWGRFLLNRFAPVLEVKAVGRFDLVIGNPPWINWENLPDDYRDAQQRVWKEYGLFRQAGSGARGTSVRLGAGKKDLSMLMTYVVIDKLLKENGHLAFLINQSVFKTEAGEGFRKFVIPQTVTFFAPLRVHDMSSFQPFEGPTNRTAAFVALKGQEVAYPVEYWLWRKKEPVYPDDSLEVVKSKTERHRLAGEPVNKAQNGILTDRWLTARPKAIRALRKFTGSVRQAYQAYAGSYTGGANGVYWLSIEGPVGKRHALITNYTRGAKRKVKQFTGYKIETDLLYPLMRGRDAHRWHAEPSLHILMVQDPDKRVGYDEKWLQDSTPLTHAWLRQFRKELSERKSSMLPKEPFYSMYAISENTFAPYKVVWREISTSFAAAVVGEEDGKPCIPDHKLMMVPCKTEQEAHYLCALLNSSPFGFSVLSTAIQIQFDPHILTRIALPKFDPKNETHKALAAASKVAHRAAAKGDAAKVTEAEQEIDRLSQVIWGLNDDELAEIKDSLAEMTGAEARAEEEGDEE